MCVPIKLTKQSYQGYTCVFINYTETSTNEFYMPKDKQVNDVFVSITCKDIYQQYINNHVLQHMLCPNIK